MDNFMDIHEANKNHGQSEVNIEFDPEVYQYYPDTCAIQSQCIILKQYGFDVTQEELIEIAKANGWYVSGEGTPMGFIGKLLEYYGVDANASYENNIFNIANELAQGHQIIVSVDSGELLDPNGEFFEDWIFGENPDHALVVVGIDTTDPNDIRVIVTDPGTGNRQWSYSEEQFMNAWKDSGCFMVSTEQSPEEFIYHDNPYWLDYFGGIPYATISQMANIDLPDSPELMDAVLESLMNNPEGWENVIDDYHNIFQIDDDGEFHFVDPNLMDIDGVDC